MLNQIELWGIVWGEPTTFITDIVLAGFSILFALRLKGSLLNHLLFWKLFFLFMGASTFVGGFGHLLFYYCGIWPKIVSWIVLCVSILSVEIAVISGLIAVFKSDIIGVILKVIVVLLFFLFSGLILYRQSFNFAMVNVGFGLFGVSGITNLVQFLSKKRKHNLILFIGFSMTLILGVIMGMRLSIHTYFNHNDIAHLVIIACLYIVYRGVKLMEDSEDSNPQRVE